MSDIISTIKNMNGLSTLKAATISQIQDAQNKLGLSFASEYKEYLEKYGVVSANSIELTGITDSKRLNVIDVTIKEKHRNEIPNDMYVIEDTCIEGILILQNSKGEIYELQKGNKIKKIFDSLSDYLKSK
jgi:hypothetical protein